MMKKLIFILLSAAVLTLTSCSEKAENLSSDTVGEASRNIFAMDTLMTFKAYGSRSDEALSEVSQKILSLESMLSVTDENSEIWKVNHSAGKETEISRETADIVSFALDISEKTDGALNPLVYPLVREWGFTTGDYKIPDGDVISELLTNTDFRKVSVSENSIFLQEGMLIDAGASAKGYAGDAAAKILSEYGVESAVLSLGGNIQTVGSKPDGSDWKVAIKDPFDETLQMCIVSVSDMAVVTSGNYERYFTGEDGKRYCHIIDPSDGYPSDNGLVSVTIVSGSGILCDCLSTAMFVKGEKAAIEYWRENGGFDMILVNSDREITVTEGLENCFETVNGMKAEIVRN